MSALILAIGSAGYPVRWLTWGGLVFCANHPAIGQGLTRPRWPRASLPQVTFSSD
jgi:hypothetical protein